MRGKRYGELKTAVSGEDCYYTSLDFLQRVVSHIEGLSQETLSKQDDAKLAILKNELQKIILVSLPQQQTPEPHRKKIRNWSLFFTLFMPALIYLEINTYLVTGHFIQSRPGFVSDIMLFLGSLTTFIFTVLENKNSNLPETITQSRTLEITSSLYKLINWYAERFNFDCSKVKTAKASNNFSDSSRPIGEKEETLELTVYGKRVRVNKQIFDSIQDAIPEDAEAIAKLSEESYRNGSIFSWQVLSEVDVKKYLEKPEKFFFKICRISNTVAGYTCGSLSNEKAHIHHTLVEKNHRHLGVGTALAVKIQKELDDKGIEEIRFHPLGKEIIDIREALGFKKDLNDPDGSYVFESKKFQTEIITIAFAESA